MALTPEITPPRGLQVVRRTARRLALISLAVLVTSTNPALGHVTKPHHIPGKPEFTDPREVVRIFLKAVDRGELMVFDQKLDRSRIIPVRVEYVYELDSLTSRMKVYSELKHPSPVPDHPDCRLRGVSAILDNYGHIIETVAHVWHEETE